MVSSDASRFGLRAEVLGGILSALQGLTDIDRAFVFGSRARGDYRNNSDIDLAIEAGGGLRAVLALLVGLEDVPTLCSFDVLDLRSEGSSSIRDRALSEGICIYERPPAPPSSS